MKLPPEQQRQAMVGVLLLWCVALVTYGTHRAFGPLGVGLLWNLFLATVPLVCSVVFRWADLTRHPILKFGSFSLWLLFLPNAPY